MTQSSTLQPTGQLSRTRGFAQSALRADWFAGICALVLLAVVVAAVLGTHITPYDPNAQELSARLIPPPFWSEGGSMAHLLGTDELGRDLLSRIIAGARLTLVIGVAAAAIEIIVGSVLGLLAGYHGGRLDALIVRLADIQMGFPSILLILLIVLTFGSGTLPLIIAIGLNGWMIFARTVRGEVIRIKKDAYVEYAQVTGISGMALVGRHIMPQLRSRLIAMYFMEVPRVVLVAAGLSFLGIGVTSPNISWGLIIGDSRAVITVAAWPSVFAGLAIVLTVVALYSCASWLEPKLDPLRRARR